MKSVVIVYHSGFGHTEKQANAVFDGAKSVTNIKANLINVSDIENHWETLANANAIIFGAPTYMGSISAEFKKFMEASSKAWMSQAWLNKLAAGFTNSASLSGDKLSSLLELSVFAAQHGMTWINLGLMPSNNSKSQRNDLNRIGAFIGAMAQSDADSGADIAPPQGDLDTAHHLGKRVAEMTLRFN